MTLSFAGARREYGVIVVEVGINPVWGVIGAMGVGQNGAAYIVDAEDRVIAHSDVNILCRSRCQRPLHRPECRTQVFRRRQAA